MVLLKAIQFEAYKAFKTKQNFILKPITILVGKNSSGKSALARLPLLLAQAFNAGSSEPIRIQFDGIEFGGAFVDLIYNKFSHGKINMMVTFDDDSILTFEVQNIADTPIQVITSWQLKSAAFDLQMKLIFDRENVLKSDLRDYMVNDVPMKVRFKGLIPNYIQEKDGGQLSSDYLNSIGELFDNFHKSLEYIGPLRENAHRTYSYSGSIPAKFGYKGEFAPQVLGMSSFVNEELVLNVGQWFKNYLGYEITVSKELRSFEISVISPSDPTVLINITDVGQGISQVLPLIVRCFSPGYHKSVAIIEQPELHLHPAAHGDLAELFATTAIREQSNFIIETHSENIILRLRRMISEKRLDHQDVIIYWIDDDGMEGSSINPITIDEDGTLSDWPDGVFSEDFEEVLAINNAKRKRAK